MVAAQISSQFSSQSNPNLKALLQGEILLQTRPHSAWGGAVTAQMYLPMPYTEVWTQLTDYSRWTQFFPDLTRSEVISSTIQASGATVKRKVKRLYQVASKAFLFLTAQVEIYLKVMENYQQSIQFSLESGSFNDFTADLALESCGEGTILTYSVQATPTIPVPSAFIQQAIRMDLPSNMKQMRNVICRSR